MKPVYLRPARDYLKKIKDKRLKALFEEAILRICEDPDIGEAKKGDLAGIYGYDVFYAGINYEIAYRVRKILDDAGEEHTVVVIMIGSRENFYQELKRYLT